MQIILLSCSAQIHPLLHSATNIDRTTAVHGADSGTTNTDIRLQHCHQSVCFKFSSAGQKHTHAQHVKQSTIFHTIHVFHVSLDIQNALKDNNKVIIEYLTIFAT